MKHQHPYKIPEDYFSKLEEEILEKKSSFIREKRRLAWSFSKAQLAISFASFALVLVISYLLVFQPSDQEIDYLADISGEALIEYLDNYEISVDEIIEGVVISDEIINNGGGFLNEEMILDDEIIDELLLDEIDLNELAI